MPNPKSAPPEPLREYWLVRDGEDYVDLDGRMGRFEFAYRFTTWRSAELERRFYGCRIVHVTVRAKAR